MDSSARYVHVRLLSFSKIPGFYYEFVITVFINSLNLERH